MRAFESFPAKIEHPSDPVYQVEILGENSYVYCALEQLGSKSIRYV